MQQKLLRIAEIIAKARIHPAPISKDESVEFESAINAEVVEIVNDQIAFTTPELLTDWLARYCASNIAGVWHDFTQTAQNLQQVSYLFHTLGLPKHAVSQLFLSLENDFGKNVLSRLSESALIRVGAQEPNIALNAIYFPFCEALPALNYSPTNLADQLGPVLTATESYFPAGKLHRAIEELAKQSQQKAESLLKAFLRRPERRTAELAANVLKVVWSFDPNRAHQKALQLTKAKIAALQRIGTIALAWFRYEHPSNEEELTGTINCLEGLCENSHKDVLPVIARAFGTLIQSLPDGNHRGCVIEGFLHLSSHENPDIQFAVASCLVHLANDSADADWFWETLDNLSGVPTRHKDTLHNLDLATYGLVENHHERITRYLQNVVTGKSHGIAEEKGRLPDLYENTVIRLIEKQQPALESTITRWFASKDIRLHQAAADIVGRFIQYMRHQPENTIRLNKAELNTLEEQDVHRVICALTGHLEDFKALAVLLISVLSRNPLGERTHNLIVEALEQVVFYNVPSIGSDLRILAMDVNTSEIVRQVIEESLARSEAYYIARKDRPRLKELLPPDSRVHRYDAAQKQPLRSLQDKIFSESGLLSVIPVTQVKYGKSSFSAEHGDITSPVPMESFTTEIDWPRELIIDPLGWTIKRMNWKHMALHGLPAESTMDSVNN